LSKQTRLQKIALTLASVCFVAFLLSGSNEDARNAAIVFVVLLAPAVLCLVAAATWRTALFLPFSLGAALGVAPAIFYGVATLLATMRGSVDGAVVQFLLKGTGSKLLWPAERLLSAFSVNTLLGSHLSDHSLASTWGLLTLTSVAIWITIAVALWMLYRRRRGRVSSPN